MTDKNRKNLAKLSAREREVTKLLILRVKLGDTQGLDIKRLKGHTDLYRVRKGRLRIVYQKNKSKFLILLIDKRSEKTYRDF